MTLVLGISILGFNACQNDYLEEEESVSENQTYNRQMNFTALNIDNGVNSNCSNNIIAFKNWEVFHQSAKYLDDQWEANIDMVNQNISPTVSDEVYEAYLDSIKFNEEQPYIDFEEQFQFCSLRKKIYDEETQWLAIQGDGEWDATTDPDVYFIDDEQRIFLNEQNEVIVKNENNDDVIYKFYPHGHVEIINNDYKVLQEINTAGPNDTITSLSLRYIPNEPPIDFVPAYNLPFIPLAPEGGGGEGGSGNGGSSGCKSSNRIERFFCISSHKKIKATDKFDHATLLGNSKVKAKTKYYHKDWGIWHTASSLITARLTAIGGLSCGAGFFPPSKVKTKRASKVKVKWIDPDLFSHNPEVINDLLYGQHKRYDYSKTIDLYDGDVQ